MLAVTTLEFDVGEVVADMLEGEFCVFLAGSARIDAALL